MENYFYQGRLPHWHVAGGTFFITYRLAGSIPKAAMDRLRAQVLSDQLASDPLEKNITQLALGKTMNHIRKQRQRIDHEILFQSMDDYLDTKLRGPFWLSEPTIASITADSLHHFNQVHYSLWTYCIMSNHVHVLLTLRKQAPPLWQILQRIKRHSSRQSNLLLGREGPFWQKESYDHLVRYGEFYRIARYILNNPVKAQMVTHWADHPWSYCQSGLLESLEM